MSKRFKESSERDEATGSRSLLSRLSSRDLKNIKVAICRRNVPEPTSPVVVQRDLEDPKELVIHRREDEGKRPIFDRRGIVVNVETHLEERIVLKSPVPGSSKRSHSKTYSDREASAESDRSQSPRSRRHYSRSPSVGSRKDSKTKSGHSKEYSKLSPSRTKQELQYKDKKYTEGSTSAKRSNRSITPSYKKNETDHYESRTYVSSKERSYRERSPKAGPSKSSRERERSPKERRDYEGYKKDKYRGSPKRVDYRDASPKRYDSNRSRSPRSPQKLNYKHFDKEKYTRPRSPPKRYSVSPRGRKRSRSPQHSRKHSPSPHSKGHSRSPHFRKTPSREVRGFRDSSNKLRRLSSSPHERDRDYHSRHSRPPYIRKRSRSPYSRKHSRSPHRTDKYRKQSLSPFRRDSDGYRRGRSRSPTRTSNRKHPESTEKGYHELVDRGLPPDYEFYGPEGFWIQGPIPKPRFVPRGALPPMAIPRAMIPPYLFPRAYIPPHPFHHFRPRLPVAYNRQYRPRLVTATVTTSGTNTISTTTAPSTSTAIVSTASTSTSSNPIIEEPVSESENVESTVQDKL